MRKIEAPIAEYYRAKSLECSVLAAQVKDPNAATLFRALAVDYFKLAAKSERPAVRNL